MRIAYLCKRHYMGKDVILDRYARLYEIPYQLARIGHTVEAYCLDYRSRGKAGTAVHDAQPGRLTWHAQSLRQAIPTYPWTLLAQLRKFNPDVVIAASDIPHVSLGAWLARRLNRPFVADLYDNFEGLGQARIPGMVARLRKAVRAAALVTTTSEPLRDLVVDGYRAEGEAIAMPSTIDKAVFRPRDAAECRAALDLPPGARLIGTAGGLSRDKGIDVLYRAWPILSARVPDAHLVLAGHQERSLPIPQGERVHFLGALPHERVAALFCALDVGVICIPQTPFGRFSFPQKAYEMLACRLPVVAANVGAMGSLFSDYPRCLYRSDDAEDLAGKIETQLSERVVANVPIDDWEQIIRNLEQKLQKVGLSGSASRVAHPIR